MCGSASHPFILFNLNRFDHVVIHWMKRPTQIWICGSMAKIIFFVSFELSPLCDLNVTHAVADDSLAVSHQSTLSVFFLINDQFCSESFFKIF